MFAAVISFYWAALGFEAVVHGFSWLILAVLGGLLLCIRRLIRRVCGEAEESGGNHLRCTGSAGG